MKKQYMIKKNDTIQQVMQQGERIGNRYFLIYRLKSLDQKNYFAFLVGKKIGKAHDRNQMRRYIKAVLQSQYQNMSPGYYYLILAKGAAKDFSGEEVKFHLEKLLKKTTIKSDRPKKQ
ncbi:MAG: ribonuclease P protein component [Culicoidibacterales bacterium]